MLLSNPFRDRTDFKDRGAAMAPRTIVSYDDTPTDHDALMLARVLAGAGAQLTLAYVRHTTQSERSREELEEHEAEALLERGARWLGDLDVERQVVVSASTSEGLGWLAEHDRADIIVFGSDYRTAAGHASFCRSMYVLLETVPGPAALAIAPANYRSDRNAGIDTIGVLSTGDGAAEQTAADLAERTGAEIVDRTHNVDMLIVGSRAEAPEGRVIITSQAQKVIDDATSPVMLLARGVPVRFAAPVVAGAH
jgi:nucleotide-binding universal stress UspA family protein